MLLERIIKFLTSLRLTVALLCLAIVLVFFGTLAQVNEGLYNAQRHWFHSFIIWWGPQGASWRIPILPGGYFVGITLVVNLIAAHISRFQMTWKKLGIHVAHAGLIVLLIGQLATDLFSRESTMSFNEGETRNYTTSPSVVELVFVSESGGTERVLSIPQSRLVKGARLANEKLPFTIHVKEALVNADVLLHDDITKAADQLSRALAVVDAEYANVDTLVPMAEKAQETPGRAEIWRAALKAVGENDVNDIVAAARKIAAQPDREVKLRAEVKARFRQGMFARFRMQGGALAYVAGRLERNEKIDEDTKFPGAASNGTGARAVLVPMAEVKTTEENNLPAFILELQNERGSLGTWLVSPVLNDQVLTVGDKSWLLAVRFERHYLPFSVQLLKTTHEVYRGTDIPRNFQSRVRLENPGKHESREVDIYMNNPLRYEGLTFYQYQMGRDQMNESLGNSVLQVVRNPGWLTPYFGCVLVAAGLLIQFGMHLTGFLKKRRKA